MANNYTVLIIDDEEDITIHLRSIINKSIENPTVRAVHSFAEAKNQLANNIPNLLFIDVNLGDGSGFDVLNIINQADNKTSKVIMMSAYVTEEEISDAKQKGVDAFMQKPFTKENVTNCIAQVLNIN